METTYKMGAYFMRPIKETDLEMILLWRNSDNVRRMMLTQHRIQREEHFRWFERIKKQATITNFIVEYNNQPIGYIGYTEYDEKDKCCSPGAYIGNTKLAERDAGLYVMFMSVEYAFSRLGMERLETAVFAKNKKALGIDQFIGYEIIADMEEKHENYGVSEDVLLLRLLKQQWEERRSILIKIMK